MCVLTHDLHNYMYVRTYVHEKLLSNEYVI